MRTQWRLSNASGLKCGLFWIQYLLLYVSHVTLRCKTVEHLYIVLVRHSTTVALFESYFLERNPTVAIHNSHILPQLHSHFWR
ncbi:hypothetical protein CPB83DRAFT_507555 [Crepidotus variabilis]|uniref:Uncharacterized protein n=1 Tax=Crepidotus variabilis TaxID=179855 RepID=A0A9P6JMR7_9AGAR|nr:hypothetical protein CPB83DRAFT_507555 [Crepidotus variabilis]